MTCRHFVGSSPCTGHDLLTDGHAQIAIDPDAMAQISKHSQSNVDQSKDTLSEENIQGLPDTDVIKLHRLIKNSLEIPNAPNVVHETDTWLQQVKYRVPGKSIAADAESSKARHETKFSCTHKELSQTAHVKPLNPHIRLLLTVGLTQRDILSWGSKIQGNKKGTFSKIFPKGLGSPKEGNKFCVIIDLNDYGAPELLSHNGFEEDQEEPGPQLLMESLQLPEALGRDDVPPIIYPELSCRNQSNSLSEQRGMTHTTDESQTKVSGPANAEGAIEMLEKFHVQSYSIPSSSRSLIKSSLRSELKAKPRSSMYEKRLLNHSVHKRTQNGSSQDQRVPSRLKNVRMTGKRVDQVSVNPPSQPNSTRVRSTHSAKHASLSTAHPTLRSSLAFLVDRRPKIPKSKRNTSSEISLASSLRERHSDDAVHRKETSTKGNYVGKGSGQHLAVPKLPGEVLDIFLNEESSRASPATGPWRRDQSHPRKQHEKSEFRSPLKPFNLYKIRSESDVSKFQGNISVAQWVKYNKACTPKSQVIARRDSRLRHVNKDHVRSQSYQFDRSSEQIEHAVQDRYDTHINLPSTSACHLESASFQDGIFLELGCISIRKTKEHFRESAQEAHVLQDVKQEDFRPRGRDPNQLLLDGQHQTSSKQREELKILAAPTVDECREVCVPGARIPHGYAVSLSKDNSLHKTCLNMQRMNFVFEEGGTSRTDDANRTQNSGKAERIWSRTMHRSKHLRSTTTDLTLQLSLHNSQPSSRLHHVNTIKLSTVELKRDMTTHGRSTSNWIERRKALKTPGAYSTRQSAIKPKVNQVQKVSQTHRKRTGETKPTNSRRHTEYFQRHSSSHQMKLASTDHQLRLQRVTQYMQPKTQLADLLQSLSEKPALGKPQDELIQPKLVPLKQVECSLPYANRTLYGDSHTPTSIFRLLRKSRSQPLRRSSQPTAQELDRRVPLYEIRADADTSVYHTVAAERERDTNTNVKSQQDIPKRSESVRSMDDDFRLQSTRHSGKRICPVVSNQETRIRARPWRSSSDEHLLPRHSEYKLFNRSFDSKTIPIQSGRYSKSSTQEVLGNPSVQQRLRYPSNRKKEGASLSLAPGVYETDQVHRPLLEISCNSDVFSPQVDALPETHFRQDDKQHRDLEKTEHINLTRDSDSTESSIRMHKLVDPASPSSPIFVAQKQPELTGELSVIEYSFRQCLDFNNQQSEKPQNYQSSSEPEMGETAMEYVDRPASMKSFHPNESRSSRVSHLSLISTRDMSEDRPSSLVRTFRKNSDRSTSTTSGLSSIGDRLRSVQQSLDRPLEENRRDSKETVLSSEKRSELIQLERTSLHYWVPGEPSGVHKHQAESATGSSVRSARQSSERKPPVSRLERRDQSVDQQVVKSSTLNDRQVESAGSRGHSTHAKFHRISMQNDELHYPNLEELEPAQTTTYPDQEVGLTAQQLHLPHSSQRQPEVQSYSARPSKLMHFGEMISMSTPQLATGNRVSKTSLKTVLASAASTSKIHNILDLQTESKTERISERDSNFGQEGKPKGRVSTSSHSKGNKVGSVDNSIKTAFGVRDRITKERYTTMRKNNQQRVYEVYGMPRIVGKRVNRDLKRQTLGEPHLVRRKLRSGSRWESEREGEDQSLANFGFRSQTPPKSDRRKRFFYSSVEQYSSPSQHSLLSDLSSTMLSRTNGKNTFEQRKADSVHALSPAFSTYSRLPIGRGKAYYRGSKNRGRTTYRVQHVLQNLRRVQQEKKRAQLAGRGRSTGSHRVNQRAGFRGRGRFSHRKSGSDIESYREYVKSDISMEQYPSIAERSLTSVQSPLSVDLSSTNLPKPRAKPRRLSEEKGRSGAQVHQTYEDRIGSDASKDRDSTNNPLKESNGITDEQDCKQKSHEIDEHSHGTRNRRSHQLRGSTMVKAQQVGKDQLVDHQQSSKHQEDTVMDHCVADLTLQDLELFSEQDSRTSGLKEHKYSPAERISVTSSARSITELSYGSLNLRPEHTSEYHVATAAGQKSSKHKTTKNLPPFIQRENTGQQRESSENREINKEISHENATVKAVNSKDKLEYPKPKPGRDSENQRIPSDKSEGSKRTHGETGGKDRTPSRERSRDKTSTGQHEKYQDQREDSSCLGQKGKPNAFPQSVTSETPLPDRITGQPTSSDARSTSPLPDNRLDDEVIATGQRSDAQVREIFIYYPEEQSRPLANSIESRLEEKPSQALLRLETATMITPSAGEQGVMGTLEDDMGVPISPYNIGQPAAHSPKHMVMGSFGGERVVSDSFRSMVPEDKSPRLADSVKPTASAQRVTSETPLPDRITGQPTSSDARSTSPLPDNSVDRDLAFFSASWNVGKYSAYGFRVTSRFLDDICVQMVVNPQGISLCVFEITNLQDSADVMEEYEPTLFAENGPLVITDSDSSESISVSCGVVLLCQEGDPLVLREINEPVLGYIFEPSQRQMSDEGKSKSGVDRITSKNVVFSPRVFVDTPVIDSDSRVPGIQVRSTDPEKPVPSFLKHQIDSTELKQSPVYQSAPQDGKNVVLVPQKSVVPGTRFRTDELPNVSLSLSKLPHDRNRDTLYLPISEYNLLIEQMPNESRDLEKEPKASCHGLQDSSFTSADADIFHACNIGSPTDVRANHGTDALYGLGADAQAPSVPLSLSNEHHSFRAEQINLSPSEVDGFEVPPHKHSGVETLRTGKILGGKRAVDQREMSNQVKPLTDSSCQATPPTNDQLTYPTLNIFIPSTGTIPSSMDPVSPDHTTNSPQALPSINNRSSQSIDGYLAFLCLPSACDLIFEQPKRESVYIIQFEPILLTPLFTVPALSDQLQLFVAYPFELQPVHLVSPFDLLYEVVPLATTYYGTTWRQETFGPQTIGKSMPSDFVLLDPPERASLVPEKVATANELEVDGSAGDPERDQAMDDQISLPVQKTSCATARHPQYSLSSCPLTPHHETSIGSLNNLPDSRAIDETSSIFEAIKGTSVVSHSKSRSVVQATSKQVSTSIFTIKPGPTENQKDLLSLTPADRLHSDISIVADVIREGHPSMGTDQNRRRNLHIDSVATGGSLLVTPRGYSVDFKLPLASSASCLLTPNTCCNRCDTQTVAACVLSDTTVQPVCCHPMASSTRDNASLGGKMESVAQRRRQPVCSFGRCPQWMCLGSGVHQHTSVTKAGKHQLDNLKHDRIEKATQSLVTLDATDRPSETLISGSGTKFPGDVIGSDVLVPVPSKQLTDVEDTKINITTVIQFGNHKHDPTGRLLNAPGCMACRGKCKRINCGSVQNDHGFQRCFQRCKPRSRSCHLSSCPLVRHREASSEMYMAAPVYELFKLNEPICPTAAMLTRKTACQSLTRRRHPECRRTLRFHCCPLADVPVTSELSGHRFSECRVKRLCCCCRGYGCDQRNCSGCGSRTTE